MARVLSNVIRPNSGWRNVRFHCSAVSDAYHVFRIRKLLEHEGIGPVYVAPRADSRPHGLPQRALAVLREATSYLLWRMGIT